MLTTGAFGHLGITDSLMLVFLLPSDQPKHAEEENCAVIRTESSGRWQNRDCSVALPYICKKRPNATLDPFTTGQCVGFSVPPSARTGADAVMPSIPECDGFCLCDPTDSWADDQKYECDVGWQAFQASCYKLTSEKMDWDAAQKTCQKMEGNLVSIHTLPELEFIMQNVKKGDRSVLKSISDEKSKFCLCVTDQYLGV